MEFNVYVFDNRKGFPLDKFYQVSIVDFHHHMMSREQYWTIWV